MPRKIEAPQGEPTQPLSAQNHDTTEMDFQAPGSDAEGFGTSPELEIMRLQMFLDSNFPRAASEPGPDGMPTRPVDLAIRLLLQLSATTPLDGVRCSNEWCNLLADHPGLHGWISTP